MTLDRRHRPHPGTPTGAHAARSGTLGAARRRAALVAGAASVAAVAAASGAGAATPAARPLARRAGVAPVVVQLWESHNGGPVGAAMTALVDRFDATHKAVRVTIVVTKASQKLAAALPAGDAPVLAEISHYDGIYVKAGALVSWNSFMAHSAVVNASNVLPAVWANGLVHGQHYRLQADLKVSEVFYNESLFAKAGITSAPTTWTGLAADASKLKALGVIPIGWKDSSAHILPAFMSNGGTLLEGGNSVGTAANFDSAAGRRTFSYFRSLYASGELQLHHGTTLREDLAAGKMAMIDGTSAGYAKVLDAVGGKFRVGAFVEPAGTTGHAANIAQGLGFVLPKGHTHAQDEAAWTFVQWWFEPAQQALWAERTGFDPEDRSGIAAVPASYLRTHPGLAASISAAESPDTLPRPVSDSYNEVQASIDAEFFDAVTAKQSVSSALATLEQQANGYLKGASEL
ncbi:MAG: extracellular solute-binding protein [Actinomycetota bacterium]|nr:extracellular solute-binding protein [Actinomycetota bacterium]